MVRAIKEAIYLRVNNPTEQKYWRVKFATYLGQSSVFHPRTKNTNYTSAQ